MTKPPTDLARFRAAQTLSKARWAGVTAEERSQFGREVAAHRTPEQMGAAKRSDKPRCPCGEMTAKRAKARGHRCVGPKKKSKKA